MVIPLPNDECRGELGYALGYKYWGKGIAPKAVKLRVLEKAGFQGEGILRKYMILKGKTRDMVMFSLIFADPQG
ncbi:putative n-acetyltransferase p20 [Quercus suber]|uniref:N-acetyltransferase p20 n=1 Tax=Quercus suber TaxID=58331 RepID=A0AAW0JDR9_QUESU